MNASRSPQKLRVWDYAKPVGHPPQSVQRYDSEGQPVGEELLIVGWFSCDDVDWLRAHQIDTSYAWYDASSARHEGCLVSIHNHHTLRDLQLQGEFMTPFCLTYSLGELCYQKQLKQGESVRPILPEWSYLVQPNDESRRELLRWQEQHRRHLRLLPDESLNP